MRSRRVRDARGGAAIMSFLDKVARIRAELLGAASDMPVTQVVAAALPLMGIVPEPSWALPQKAAPMSLGHILSSSGAKSLPIFLTLGILNAGPGVYVVV